MRRITLLIITSILTFTVISGIVSCVYHKNSSEENSTGKDYITKLEDVNLGEVENEIDTYKKEYFNAKYKKEGKSKNIKEEDNHKYYENTVFMGDSITEGLSVYDVVNKYNVFGFKGDTVVKAMEHVDEITSLNPKNLVLFYGMNDVIAFGGLNNGKATFKDKYTQLVNEAKNKFKDSKIYLISPLPVKSYAANVNKFLTENYINKFRECVKEVATENEVIYIDMVALANEHSDLYEKDGIHFKYEFYPIWLEYIKDYIKN